MNLHALTWILAFTSLSFLGLTRRPIFSFSAYLMTFYLSPNYWWWGDTLTGLTSRWNLTAAVLLVLATALTSKKLHPSATEKRFFLLIFIYTVNAFFVHFAFASNPEISWLQLDTLWKSSLLIYFLSKSVRDQHDLHIALATVTLIFAYIGYAVVFQGQGGMVKGRLEGISIPGAAGSNGIACVASMSLIFSSYLVMTAPFKYGRYIGLISAPLTLELILRGNSRGAFVGMIVSGLILFLVSGSKMRKQVMALACLALTALSLQMKDEGIWNRFQTTFVGEEERDASAQSRIEYWKAGIRMINDYPLGSGGRSAFISDRGQAYIRDFNDTYRSVHNGYLSIAAGWGVQGFLALSLAYFVAVKSAAKSLKKSTPSQHHLTAFLLATLSGQFVCTMFGDYLDGEWFLILGFMLITMNRLASSEQATELHSSYSFTTDEGSIYLQSPTNS